jgi:hypothetical protein
MQATKFLAASVLLASVALCQTAPQPDTDGDGIVDSQDPCQLTPRGAPAILRGCSALDLAERPAFLVGPLAAQLAEAAGRMSKRPELSAAATELEPAFSLVDLAGDTMQSGRICEAAPILEDARRRVGTAKEFIEREIKAARARLKFSRGKTPWADFDEAEAAIVFLEIRAGDLDQWDKQAARLARRSGSAERSNSRGRNSPTDRDSPTSRSVSEPPNRPAR